MIILKQRFMGSLVATVLCVTFFATESFATEAAELADVQKRVVSVAEKCVQSTVALQIGGAGGSGVIITKDGYVLSAAHVTRKAGLPVTAFLHDGTRVKGKTLGLNLGADYSLIKLNVKKTLKFRPLGTSKTQEPGDWVIATGHPLGYRRNRPPVLRLGRVLSNRPWVLQTDCPLVSGDSGGPLFDLEGKVIGINSFIGPGNEANYHIPTDLAWQHRDKLMAGKKFGPPRRGMPGSGQGGAFLGVRGRNLEEGEVEEYGIDAGVVLAEVIRGSAAEKSGLKVGDVLLTIEGATLGSTREMVERLSGYAPGDDVKVKILREDETMTMVVKLGKR